MARLEAVDGALPVRAVLVDAARFHAGALVVRDGRIVAECEAPARAPHDWFAIPGLRNAHTHLDLSDVQVPRADRGFAAWVLDLIKNRPFDPGFLQRGAERGARLSLAAGTTAVGDIDSSGAAAAAVATSGLKGVAFREFLGSAPIDDVARAARAWRERFVELAPGGRLRPGFSPHAPYSTAPPVYAALAAEARAGSSPFTTHVAETRAEAQYLATGDGELADLLRTLKALDPVAPPPGISPLAHLDRCGGLFPGALLAHANYPEPGDLERLQASGAGVVFCPRSHRFFGHSRHPIAEYLAAGVPVALGTDSLASNSSLSLLDEMAYLRVARPDLPAAVVFDAATRQGARVLEGADGRLVVGEAADLVICAAPGKLPADLCEALELVTSGLVRVVATIVSGEVCHATPDAVARLLPLTPGGAGLFSGLSSGGPAASTQRAGPASTPGTE